MVCRKAGEYLVSASRIETHSFYVTIVGPGEIDLPSTSRGNSICCATSTNDRTQVLKLGRCCASHTDVLEAPLNELGEAIGTPPRPA